MAVLVTGIVVFWWPVLAWGDYRLRRAWHDAIIAFWIPRYGDRTSLVDLTTLEPKSRALEDRVYRRWQPPIIIGIPARGRIATVSFADVMDNPAQLERRFQDVARVTFDDL
jgi:hypothetical protein